MMRQFEAGSCEPRKRVPFLVLAARRIGRSEITWPEDFFSACGLNLNAFGASTVWCSLRVGRFMSATTTTARAFARATAEDASGAPTRSKPNGPTVVFENGRDARRHSRF